MKQRNLAFDLIKIIACYLVIVNHTGLYVLSYGSKSPFLVSFYSTFFIFCKIAVPLFIMVSGSLLLSREESYQRTLSRIVKVAVPLVVLSLALFVYRNGIGSILDFFPSFLKTAAIVPFWYL